jgi:DNA modification methylase
MSKNYKQLLPIRDDIKVTDQLNGYLPLSVMEFSKEDKKDWSEAYYPQDDSTMRRGRDAGYLPGLQHSEFHGGLCEFILRYWSMKNSIVVDPFAGRATRAVISSRLKRKYFGYEISSKTYNNSLSHYKKIGLIEPLPVLYNNDGCKLEKTKDEFAHLVFSCPPYHSLENYESTDGQLSDCKTYEDFLSQIKLCSKNVYRVMKPGAFLVWVVADWRDDKGYRQFSNDSINIFKDAGLMSHDTMIFKNQSPFAALQTYKTACKRITSKVHEFVLVFRKSGDLDISGLEIDDINEKSNEFFE